MRKICALLLAAVLLPVPAAQAKTVVMRVGWEKAQAMLVQDDFLSSIRVEMQSGKRLKGKLIGTTDEALRIERKKAETAVAREDIRAVRLVPRKAPRTKNRTLAIAGGAAAGFGGGTCGLCGLLPHRRQSLQRNHGLCGLFRHVGGDSVRGVPARPARRPRRRAARIDRDCGGCSASDALDRGPARPDPLEPAGHRLEAVAAQLLPHGLGLGRLVAAERPDDNAEPTVVRRLMDGGGVSPLLQTACQRPRILAHAQRRDLQMQAPCPPPWGPASARRVSAPGVAAWPPTSPRSVSPRQPSPPPASARRRPRPWEDLRTTSAAASLPRAPAFRSRPPTWTARPSRPARSRSCIPRRKTAKRTRRP